ncbi:MAG TPA: caspase family protein [Hyphomonadaceae bacterium]|jgi:hypothetical protein|nr:caspase family protein [Hyphomonadaceae bacterium]
MGGLSKTWIGQGLARLAALAGLVLFALFAAAPSLAQEKRIALVIGNGTYAEVNSLSNSINDARLMRSTLQSLGFEVIYKENMDKRSMEKVLGDFANKLEAAGSDAVSLVYYAGHGVQLNGENYLLPVDVPLRRAADLGLNAIRAGDVLNQMESAKSRVKIVILDACRDNPFELTMRSVTRGGGLADMRLGNTEFFIAYAATSGNVAWDGDGDARNSPYALALAKFLATPDTEISEIFRMVRNEVATTTRNRQLPEARTTLRQQFFFNPRSGGTRVAAATNGIYPPPASIPVAPVPVVVAERDADAVAPINAGRSSLPAGAPITIANLMGKWCLNSRNGMDFSMTFRPKIWEQNTGTLNLYDMTISQVREDLLRVESPQKDPKDPSRTVQVVATFGQFSDDGKTMNYIQASENGVLKTYNQQFRKCG